MPALARLALERVDERQGDGRGGSELELDLGAQAVQARERRPSHDRAVAVEGDDGRIGRACRARRRERRRDREQRSCCDARAPASGRHRDRSAGVMRATTDRGHRVRALLMPPVGSLRTVGGGRSLEVASSEPRRQPARRDLAGGPPQALFGDLSRRGFPGRIGAQVAGAIGGPQEAAQDGTVRARGVLGTQLPRDLLGDDVGLLGGQPALLVRAGGRVADGEDVVVVAHPEGVVDEDEAVAVAGDARAVGPGEEGRCTTRSQARLAPGESSTLVGCGTVARTPASSCDTGGRERRAHPLARRARRTRSSGSVSGVTRVSWRGVGQGRNHERQLVGRQRPRAPRRNDDREALGRPLRRSATTPSNASASCARLKQTPCSYAG